MSPRRSTCSRLLHARGAELSYSDPHVATLVGETVGGGKDLSHTDPQPLGLMAYDCVVIVTEHAAFDYDCLQRIGRTVVDTRNAIKNPQPHVLRLGAPTAATVDRDLVGVA